MLLKAKKYTGVSFTFFLSSPFLKSLISGGVVSYDVLKRVYAAVWHHITRVRSKEALHYIYCMPDIIKAKGLTQNQYYMLLRINFMCAGGRTCLDNRHHKLKDYDRQLIAQLNAKGLIKRSYFNSFTPHRSASKTIQHVYIYITAEGLNLIANVNQAINNTTKADSMNIVFYDQE